MQEVAPPQAPPPRAMPAAMPQAATPPGPATGGRDQGDAKKAKCVYTESDPIGYAWQAMSYESDEVLGPRAMARCAVGLLGDDDDERQISETGHGGGYRGVG